MESRMFKGNITSLAEHPYFMMSFGDYHSTNNRKPCGAVLIDYHRIITAAACELKSPYSPRVTIGLSSWNVAKLPLQFTS